MSVMSSEVPSRRAWANHLRDRERWAKAKTQVKTDKGRRLVALLDDVDATLREIYILDESLAGVSRGWAYTPLKGKVPYLSGWTTLKAATKEDLEAWVQDGCNLGLRTGEASGVYAVDIDSKEIPDHFPKTVTVRTGRGFHLYFRHIPGLRNTRNRLGDGIDTRGDGGQVVAVGSCHENGSVYAWVPGLSPDDVDLAEMPGWMIEALR